MAPEREGYKLRGSCMRFQGRGSQVACFPWAPKGGNDLCLHLRRPPSPGASHQASGMGTFMKGDQAEGPAAGTGHTALTYTCLKFCQGRFSFWRPYLVSIPFD